MQIIQHNNIILYQHKHELIELTSNVCCGVKTHRRNRTEMCRSSRSWWHFSSAPNSNWGSAWRILSPRYSRPAFLLRSTLRSCVRKVSNPNNSIRNGMWAWAERMFLAQMLIHLHELPLQLRWARGFTFIKLKALPMLSNTVDKPGKLWF